MLMCAQNHCHPDQAAGLANARAARGGTWCFSREPVWGQPPSAVRRSAAPRRARMRGFTLLELMIVLSIMMILMSIAVPMYNRSVVQSREAVLRQNLNTIRNVIQQYTLDKQKAPQSLDDIVTAGYLRQIPMDPMTRETNWEVVQEDVMLAVDQQDPGITDVHSASNGTSTDGTAYSTW